MIIRKSIEEITGQITSIELRDIFYVYFESKTHELCVSKIDRYHNGIEVRFLNGQHLALDLRWLPEDNFNAVKYAHIDALLSEIKRRVENTK